MTEDERRERREEKRREEETNTSENHFLDSRYAMPLENILFLDSPRHKSIIFS